MNKTAFTDELYHLLKPLPKAERQQHIDFYAEMIEDRMEDGVSEEEAVAALGSAADIASQILGETPPTSTRKIRVWEIILIVLGSPIWLTLLLSIATVALGIVLSIATVYLLIWACIATLYCGVLALLAGAFAGIIGGVYYLINGITAAGILFLGGALVCAGCTILLFFTCNKLAVCLWKLGKWTVLKTIRLFRRKDGNK